MRTIQESECVVFWEKLGQFSLLRKLATQSLNPLIARNLKWAVIRHNKLVYTFDHKGATQEFIRTKEQIKANLRLAYKQNLKECKAYGVTFSDIACQTCFVQSAQETKPYIPPRFKEQSSGEFEVSANNPFKAQFEAIKKAIKNNIKEEKQC